MTVGLLIRNRSDVRRSYAAHLGFLHPSMELVHEGISPGELIPSARMTAYLWEDP